MTDARHCACLEAQALPLPSMGSTCLARVMGPLQTPPCGYRASPRRLTSANLFINVAAYWSAVCRVLKT